VAEGIETRAQQQFLQQAQCAFGQGFVFSKPLRAHEVSAALGTAPGVRDLQYSDRRQAAESHCSALR
ncbi:MAG TPA: hypothetical protein VFT99_23830, partial [Roseiflexaceae bacterium]|nr:hypothetical protein [Roseiflexaceae bacterium]